MIDEVLREKLKKIIPGEVLFDEPMDRHTSIGVGGKADALMFPAGSEELEKAVSFLRQGGLPFLPVGNCTNLIVRDGGYRGVLISLKEMRGRSIRRAEGGAFLYAEAGTPLSEIVRLSLDEALTGMEFCAGIPGSVGGALRMNAGAYGQEMKDVVRVVSLINGNGRVRRVGRGDLGFSYRNLDLPEGAVVIGAEFFLENGSAERIGSRVAEIVNLRKAKHPLQYRSAGSVFKNPASVPAGKLIDHAGLKGKRIGGAMVSAEHGNFIVNTGTAKAADIIALIEFVEEKVFETQGVRLEREVKIIGEEE